MSFTVTYSGLNSNEPPKRPWGDITPYLSVEEERNWSANQNYTLRSLSLDGSFTESGINQLKNNYASYGYTSNPIPSVNFPLACLELITGLFGRSFGVIEAKDENSNNIIRVTGFVESFDIGDQNLVGKVDYSIVFKEYDNLAYSGINPSETISLDEQEDGKITITHTVSAAGVNRPFLGTDPVAFNTVKTFVQSRTGAAKIKNYIFSSGYIPTGNNNNPQQSGIFLNQTSFGSDPSAYNFNLVSQTESIDRINASYSITENFAFDTLRNTSTGIKRFSVDLNSGINDDYIVVNVSCDIQGGKDFNFYQTTGLLSNITGELFNVASSFAPNITLCQTPIAFSINTTTPASGYTGYYQTGNTVLQASCAFDNSPTGTFFDCSIDYQTDELEQVTTLNLNGNVRGRGLDLPQKFDDASGYFFNTLVNQQGSVKKLLYNKAISGFGAISAGAGLDGIIAENNGAAFGFNPEPENLSVNLNTGLGQIDISCSFSDQASVSGYSNFSWSVDVDAGSVLLNPKASCVKNGFYLVQDFNITGRTVCTINGSFEFASGQNVSSTRIGTSNDLPHNAVLTGLLKEEEYNSFISSLSVAENNDVYVETDEKNLSIISGQGNNIISSGFNFSISKSAIETADFPLKIYKIYKQV